MLQLHSCPPSIWLSGHPITSLSLSCSISEKATISPALLTSREFPEALMRSSF